MLIASFPNSGAGPSDRLPRRDKILFDKVVLGIVNSKKIVVVAGAGMSCSSGIPDFRSETGLYSLVEQMTSAPDSSSSSSSSSPSSSSSTLSNPFQTGKDLFTSTTAFSTPHSTSLYLRFIGSLLLASRGAKPTRTHRLLKRLEERGRLLRLWTQNVDGLEGRIGLTGARNGMGEDEWMGKRASYTSVVTAGSPCTSASSSTPTPISTRSIPASRRRSLAKPRQPQPTTIELHGNVHFARCNLCSEEYPTRREWVDEWVQGRGVGCEACAVRAIEREFRNARPLKSGILLPSLVLYDQPHPQGEDIILAQDKDIAKKPDCLIILGTSLKVVGIKRMVKDFIKTIREEQAVMRGKAEAQLEAGLKGKTLTPTQAAKVKKPLDRLPVIFVNKTRPDKEWEPLVDVWIEAECDAFAEGVERVWKGVRPGDWEVQETLDGGKSGWMQVTKQGETGGKEMEMGKPITVPTTPRKNKGRDPLGPGGHLINHSETITIVTPSTPKGKSEHVNPIGPAPPTPMKTPQKTTASSLSCSTSSRTLKRTRDEENDPFSSSGATILLPPTPERTPKRRRRHTDYGPVTGSRCGLVDLPSTPRRYRTRSRVPGFGSDDSDLSEGLA